MNLLLSLIMGEGRKRIVSLLKAMDTHIGHPPQIANVLVRGFSAGSFVGLTVLHLLWQWQSIHAAGGVLGAIACPPALLDRIPLDKMQHVVLLHYWADQLCMWRPEEGHALARRTVYGHGDWKMLNHFGSQEHNYCHWLDNVPPLGQHPLWKVMLRNPDMANPQKRDASALRLLSGLSFSLDRQTSALLASILRIVHESDIGASWSSLAETRAGLKDQITISKMQPHQRIRDHNEVRQLTSHYLSLHRQDGTGFSPPAYCELPLPLSCWACACVSPMVSTPTACLLRLSQPTETWRVKRS